jgi:hypothetical protein
MPVLLLMEAPGMSTDTYDRVNELAGVGERIPEGLISHVAAVDGDTLLVADVWESEEAINRFFAERLGAALAQAGVDVQPRILPVHNTIAHGAGTTAGVLLLWEADGFTPDAYDQVTARMPAHAGDGSAHPGVSHAAAITENGMFFADVWDSPESVQQFVEEQIGPAAGGATPPGAPRFGRVHNRLVGA